MPAPLPPARRRRSRWPWLVAALVLAVAGAWLMLSTDPVIPEEREFSLPTRMRGEERRRGEQRRTWVAPVPESGPVAPARPARDPVMALMPGKVEQLAVVAEFNAIVNSDLGGLMMQCLFAGDDRLLGALRDAGVDPATSIDRVAMIDDTLVVTGNFQGDRWKGLVPGTPLERGYGRQGRVYEWSQPDGGAQFLGSWGEQLLITGRDRQAVEQALDRLESPAAAEPGVLNEDQAWGELYGVLNPALLSEVLAQDQPALAQSMSEAASGVTLHADVRHDVGLVADIQGSDPKKTEELRRSLGGALSMARMQAQAKGNAEQAQLLDSARVAGATDGTFRMSAGLPYEMMEKAFTDCVARRQARRAARLDGGSPAPVEAEADAN